SYRGGDRRVRESVQGARERCGSRGSANGREPDRWDKAGTVTRVKLGSALSPALHQVPHGVSPKVRSEFEHGTDGGGGGGDAGGRGVQLNINVNVCNSRVVVFSLWCLIWCFSSRYNSSIPFFVFFSPSYNTVFV
ncbi:unnamed protein product, partial [Ectocarpus fasciculatus]